MGREPQCGPCSGRLSLTSGRQSRYMGITDHRSGDGHRPASRGGSRFTGQGKSSVQWTGIRDRISNFQSRSTGRQSHPKTKIPLHGAGIPDHLTDPVLSKKRKRFCPQFRRYRLHSQNLTLQHYQINLSFLTKCFRFSVSSQRLAVPSSRDLLRYWYELLR